MALKNKMLLIPVGAALLACMLFSSESFIIIRAASLTILAMFILMTVSGRFKEMNIFSVILFGIYLLSVSLAFIFKSNMYGIRMHFIEYSAYFILTMIIASGKWNIKNVLWSLIILIMAGAVIQGIYSVPQMIKGAVRIDGNTNYANFLSMFLAIAFWVSGAATVMLARGSRYKYSIITGIIGLISILLMLKTGSRNVLVLLPVIMLMIAFMAKKKRVVVFVIALMIVIAILPTRSRYRMLHEKEINPYGIQRMQIYRQMLDIGAKNIPMGIGYGNMEFHSLRNNFPVEGRTGRYASHAKIAHNEYIEWFANAGISGIAIWLIILFIILVSLMRLKNDSENQIPLGILILFAVYSLIDSSLYLPLNAMIFFIALGITLNSFRRASVSTAIKYIFITVAGIIILLNALDITRFAVIKHINRDKNKTADEIPGIRNTLSAMYAISGNPDDLRELIKIDEFLFTQTGHVDHFYSMINRIEELINDNPISGEGYLKQARIFRKYSSTVLSRNPGNDDIIINAYKKAIMYNPFNPFIRAEYASFLNEKGLNDEVLEQLEKAVEMEPNFIMGYRMISEISDSTELSEQSKSRISQLENNMQFLKKNAKTDYEKALIQ